MTLRIDAPMRIAAFPDVPGDSGVFPPRRTALVVVPRRLLCDLAVFQSRLHHRALVHLSDGRAEDFLPYRRSLRDRRQTILPAPRDFLFRHEHVATAFVQIDSDDIAGPQPGEAAADRAFRRGVEDGGTVRGARLPTVANRREARDSLFQKRIG